MRKNLVHGITTDTGMLQGRDYVRELVRIRDNRTCMMCERAWQHGKRRFDVHHLNGLCGKRSRGYDSVSDLDVLITLCHKCHYRHHQYSNNML